jgi:hypothetical protein
MFNGAFACLRTLTVTFLIIGDALTHFAAAGVGCQIQAHGTDSGSHLEAIISADGPVAGTYKFSVSRSGSTSPTVLSGNFEIKSAGHSDIKREIVELGQGESFSASLEIHWPRGSSACSASGSS